MCSVCCAVKLKYHIFLYQLVRLQLTIKFGFLENLHLPDKNVMKRIDGLACLLNVTTKSIWDPINKIQSITSYYVV